MSNDKILEAISGLIPEDVRDQVSAVMTTAIKEAVANLDKEYDDKLAEAYQELVAKRTDDQKIAEQGYAQAYEAITDLRNRLETQKQEFEKTLEEEYGKAYSMLQEERNKNESLADNLYEEYEGRLKEVKEWLIDRVDEFLAKKGEEYYEQARRDVLNDPYLAEHRAAFEKVLEVAADFISDDECMNKTSSKVEEMNRQVEHTKIQVRALESKNMKLMAENNQMKEYVHQTKELVKEHTLNERHERVAKSKKVESRGQTVVEPKREVVIGETNDATADNAIVEQNQEPKTIADQWNFLANYNG